MSNGHTTKRRNDGRFNFSRMDRKCVCGHTLGEHTVGTDNSRLEDCECLARDCECTSAKLAKKQTEVKR